VALEHLDDPRSAAEPIAPGAAVPRRPRCRSCGSSARLLLRRRLDRFEGGGVLHDAVLGGDAQLVDQDALRRLLPHQAVEGDLVVLDEELMGLGVGGAVLRRSVSSLARFTSSWSARSASAAARRSARQGIALLADLDVQRVELLVAGLEGFVSA
jgi:hypothetical protein